MSTPSSWTSAVTALVIGTLALAEARAWQEPDDGAAPEEAAFEEAEDLLDLSLEELLRVEVTSVSKHEERQFAAPAAVSVLTAEDIRRSGIRQLPELLRLVPGMQVGQINASTWAISSRGFADQFANKLQVLQDGRSLYTHLFSGVYWQVPQPILADLERIEVIRGPGATLWGANAVNGVINVITKSARDTQGGYVEAGSGTQLQGFSALRYGGELDEDIYYRVFAQHMNVGRQETVTGTEGFDQWESLHLGFRLDGYRGENDHWMIQGEAHSGKFGGRQFASLLSPPITVSYTDREDIAGGHLLGRYELEHGDELQSRLQFYYDRLQRESRLSADSTTDTFDCEYQLDWTPSDTHRVTTGLGYRAYLDQIEPSIYIDIHRQNRLTQLINFFVQDQIELVEDRLDLTLGSKLEQNQFTNLAFQPNVRLSYRPSDNHTIWGSISRAVRLPSRFEDEGRVRLTSFPDPGSGAPTEVSLYGTKDFRSETLTAFELGYRSRPVDRLVVDIAAFVHDYEHLNSFASGAPIVDPVAGTVTLPQFWDNDRQAQSYGLEVQAHWQVLESWRLQGTYSFLKILDRPDAPSLFVPLLDLDKNAARNQATLRSQWNVIDDVELDAFLSYVDVVSGVQAPAYVRTDLRLGWRPTETLELSLVGQNLFDSRHREFAAPIGLEQTEVERNVYFSIALRF
ncbi:MAG: TonB-dependent receptor [Planctomycetota bacterium]